MWDKLSINTARIDEGVIVINECNIEKTIKEIIRSKNIKVTKEEIDFYAENFSINKLQQNLLFNFFSKYFGSTETLYSSNRTQYIILLLIMKKILLIDKFEILPYIITGTIKNINEKSTLNKKTLVDIINSNEYDDLINLKYYFTEYNVKNGGSIILKLVANILNNKFLYNEYGDYEDNGEEIKIGNVNLLKFELLRFISIV